MRTRQGLTPGQEGASESIQLPARTDRAGTSAWEDAKGDAEGDAHSGYAAPQTRALPAVRARVNGLECEGLLLLRALETAGRFVPGTDPIDACMVKDRPGPWTMQNSIVPPA